MWVQRVAKKPDQEAVVSVDAAPRQKVKVKARNLVKAAAQKKLMNESNTSELFNHSIKLNVSSQKQKVAHQDTFEDESFSGVKIEVLGL